ncbi:hypothetical protein OUZ56_028280 [Daphnia magna]|uniref:Secreted protein n=1 Tax=Daphnia magna TaxID=35525 RepID=A0ABR0B3D3_9CRUS|nr:hypothetical protein OUZ56_028280 [Daphnia magna]
MRVKKIVGMNVKARVCSPYLALTAACVFRSPRVPPPAGLLCLDASLLERYRHPQSRGGCVCEEPVYYTYTQCTPYDAQGISRRREKIITGYPPVLERGGASQIAVVWRHTCL